MHTLVLGVQYLFYHSGNAPPPGGASDKHCLESVLLCHKSIVTCLNMIKLIINDVAIITWLLAKARFRARWLLTVSQVAVVSRHLPPVIAYCRPCHLLRISVHDIYLHSWRWILTRGLKINNITTSRVRARTKYSMHSMHMRTYIMLVLVLTQDLSSLWQPALFWHQCDSDSKASLLICV